MNIAKFWETELIQTLVKAMNESIAIPQPVWLLRLGAFIIGTETELLLKAVM